MSHRRRRRGEHEEEHENHERWLVSYADMITVLMALFIVLFAISQVDQEKFNALKQSLAMGFGTTATSVSVTTPMDSSGAQPSPIDLQADIPRVLKNTSEKEIRSAVSAADQARTDRLRQEAQHEVKNLSEVQRRIHEALKKRGLAGSVQFRIDERGLVVTIVTDKVVFAGDRADLLPAGQHILDAIGPELRTLPNSIEVDGHTNQLPVPTRNYPSAWELSAARASSVVRYLIAHEHLASKRLFAAGFGDERPLYPPSDPRAVTQNRRVEVVVLSTLPPESRALLPTVAPAAGRN